jgi:SAM-dependent methyltransferase
MPLPGEKKFLKKFLGAIEKDKKVRDAYYQRFDSYYDKHSIAQSRDEVVLGLSFYGGYRARHRLIAAVSVTADDCVLDIGPEMGMECFLLAEIYHKVIVAEPDARTVAVLRGLAEHYITEQGRKAKDILDIRPAGIIPPGATLLTRTAQAGPRGPVSFDASGAGNIGNIIGLHFADRVLCHHIGIVMPLGPELAVLLGALSSYCKPGGIITWSDSISELSRMTAGHVRRIGYGESEKSNRGNPPGVTVHSSLDEVEEYITSLLPGFSVSFQVFSRPAQLLTIARRER